MDKRIEVEKLHECGAISVTSGSSGEREGMMGIPSSGLFSPFLDDRGSGL